MKKALIPIALVAFCFVATDAFAVATAGGTCLSAFKKAQQPCNAQASSDATDSVNQSGQDIKDKSLNQVSSDSASATGIGSSTNSDWGKACQTPAYNCAQACKNDSSNNAKGNLSQCLKWQENAKNAIDQGSGDKSASQDAKKSADGSGMQMPQMPQQQQQPQNQQQPTAEAAPASTSPNCTANPSATGCTPTTQTDQQSSATPASFGGGSGGNSGSGGGGSGSNTSFDTSSTPSQPATPSAMTPYGSGGGSGGLGNSGNANSKEPNPNTLSDMGKDLTNVLNGERSGSGGGGGSGGFSYSNGSEGATLASYLPGGKNDPRKAAMADKGRSPASVEVASVHENIFSMITKRIRILCKLREIRDCD